MGNPANLCPFKSKDHPVQCNHPDHHEPTASDLVDTPQSWRPTTLCTKGMSIRSVLPYKFDQQPLRRIPIHQANGLHQAVSTLTSKLSCVLKSLPNTVVRYESGWAGESDDGEGRESQCWQLLIKIFQSRKGNFESPKEASRSLFGVDLK
jgi:hypothetical protein